MKFWLRRSRTLLVSVVACLAVLLPGSLLSIQRRRGRERAIAVEVALEDDGQETRENNESVDVYMWPAGGQRALGHWPGA